MTPLARIVLLNLPLGIAAWAAILLPIWWVMG